MPKKNQKSFLQKTRAGYKRVHVPAAAQKSPIYEELKPGTLIETSAKQGSGMRDIAKPRLPDLSNRVAGMSIVAKQPVASKEDVFKMLGDRLQGSGIKSLNRIRGD